MMEFMACIIIRCGLFINRKVLTGYVLPLLVILLNGCGVLEPIGPYDAETPRPTASDVQELSISRSSRNFPLPTWTQLTLPPGCSFHSLSPDLHWVMMMGCPTESSATNLLAQVDESGKLFNMRQIESRFAPYNEGTGVMGYTFDSSYLILEQNNSYWLVKLVDLLKTPYMSNTIGTSGVEHFGSERWSNNGHLWLSPDCWGCGQIFVASPSDQTKETIFEDVGRHGAQFNWSANGKEIVYVEGDYHEGMRARRIDLQTHQSRTLVETKYPASLTGASCSPGGKWIAVREQNIKSSEDAALWLIDAGTWEKTRLAYRLLDVEVYYGWQDLVWSPDGSKLALRGSNENSAGFVVIEIPSGKIVHRGTKETMGNPLVWSADGKSLLVIDFYEEANSARGNDILRWVALE